MRTPLQVLVYPYRFDPQGRVEYALPKQVDNDYWQAVAGGGEDQESPLESAGPIISATRRSNGIFVRS